MKETNHKIELLSPAGSKEAFISAVKGGADSIYIGIENYNARQKADYISLYDLEVLIHYAHSLNIKVYAALNIIIKQKEIKDAISKISKISQLNPDGIIVQDIGIADIIRKYFPNINLHASTQLAVHNSFGVLKLADMGFKRVVLARELSSLQIKTISEKSKIELEVFCHGALCFCISGLCLFSSALGGHSGNRGRCTQPCRRIWSNDKIKGYLFSPKDLQLSNYFKELKETGITSLKIEGRMRSSEYVYRATKAYRILIDSDEKDLKNAIKEANNILSMDWSREKTSCLFTGHEDKIFNIQSAQCLGKKIGEVVKSENTNITITSIEPLKKGDRIRIADPERDKTKALTLNEFVNKNELYTFTLLNEKFIKGCTVYKAGDSFWDSKNINKELEKIFHNYTPSKKTHHVDDILKHEKIQIKIKKNLKKHLWIKIDNPGWLSILPKNSGNITKIFYLTKENIHYLKDSLNLFKKHNIACEITPYINQEDLLNYKHIIKSLVDSGINFWILNNISNFVFFEKLNVKKAAGPFLYACNIFSIKAFSDIGISYFINSWEDDFENIRNLSQAGFGSQIIINVFGHPAICRSKMISDKSLNHKTISGTQDMQFNSFYESGSLILTPSTPVILFKDIKKLESAGISNFCIDLCFVKPDKYFGMILFDAFYGKRNIPEVFKFNFIRGLK